MRTATSTLLVLPLLAAVLSAQGWRNDPATGKSYLLTPVLTWQDAENLAVALGGHLAAIGNQAERDWLLAAFGNETFWIGLTDQTTPGAFHWTSGAALTFSDWAPGQPSNSAGEDFVLASLGGTGWDDVTAGQMARGIIEDERTPRYTTFGMGCAGTRPFAPYLQPVCDSWPITGQSLELSIGNLPTADAFFILGVSDSTWASNNLPLELSTYGLPGCTLYVSLDAVFPVTAPSGFAQVSIPIPNRPGALGGFKFYNQVLALDPGANTFLGGAVVSNAGAAVIGSSELPFTGSGPSLDLPLGIAQGGNQAFVADANLPGIIRVDLTTGDRSVISDNAVGSGPPFVTPLGISIDSGRALVADASLQVIMEVDLTTGARTVFSGAATGAGPVFFRPSTISEPTALPAMAGTFVLVVDTLLRTVFAVDLASGDRHIVSSPLNQGPQLVLPAGIAVDGGRALVADPLLSAIIAIDLATGSRSVLADPNTGAGPGFYSDLDNPLDLVVDGNRALVVDPGSDSVLAVDLATGDRTLISANSYLSCYPSPPGPDFGQSLGIALDGKRALVLESTDPAIISVELATGQRVILSK